MNHCHELFIDLLIVLGSEEVDLDLDLQVVCRSMCIGLYQC